MKALLLVLVSCAAAADRGPELLNAAKKGMTDRVRTLLSQGANIEATDKDRRTSLMLAAQHGHADTVRVLLAKGAKADARDRQGWTAYGLALFGSGSGSEEVLRTIPHPQRLRVVVIPRVGQDNLYSSCFQALPQLAQYIQGLKLDGLVFAAIRDYAAASGKDAAEILPAGSEGDAVVDLRLRPSASCVQQESRDNVSLAIDIRVMRRENQPPLYEKTVGGGLKGLHARMVSGAAQYPAILEELLKGHIDDIYWAVVGALLRTSA